ncbi:MAG: DUF3108 domain-containing protein [Massilia sp.]
MQSRTLRQSASAAALLVLMANTWAQEHIAIKRPFDLPPSADLSYSIDARKKGIALGGDAQISWRVGQGSYSANNVARASFLGKILDNRTEGTVDSFGLAPTQFYEKRFRKDATTATFDRSSKTISFADGKQTYPLLGGEQDRASAQWQLAALARAAPDKFVPGSEWKFFVAGRHDAEVWTFRVLGRETLSTPMGSMPTVHFIKQQPDAAAQKIDLWLAPGHEWYPVKLRISEEDGEFVQQTIDKITKK